VTEVAEMGEVTAIGEMAGLPVTDETEMGEVR